MGARNRIGRFNRIGKSAAHIFELMPADRQPVGPGLFGPEAGSPKRRYPENIFKITERASRSARIGGVLKPPATDVTLVQRRSRRRRRHKEPWSRVTVVLMDRQVRYLDQLATCLWKEARVSMPRTWFVRALVEALIESDIDLTGAETEEDLKALIRNGMHGGYTLERRAGP